MADERKRVAGELTAWHLAGLVARLPLTAQVLNFQEINPYGGPRPKNKKLEELIAWKEGMKLKMLADGA